MSKYKKVTPRNKVDLELLHRRLGQISTRSLMAEDTVNIWKDIELRIDPDPFCISCQISTMNKKAKFKNLLEPKIHFKWVSWILFQKQQQNVLKMRLLF